MHESGTVVVFQLSESSLNAPSHMVQALQFRQRKLVTGKIRHKCFKRVLTYWETHQTVGELVISEL